jgi:hypothetical protein
MTVNDTIKKLVREMPIGMFLACITDTTVSVGPASCPEAELLMKINQGIPLDIQKLYNELMNLTPLA